MKILATDVVGTETLTEGEAIAKLQQKQGTDAAGTPGNEVGDESAGAAAGEGEVPIYLTAEQLQTAIDAAVVAAVDVATQDLKTELTELRSQNAALKTQKDSLEQVFKVLKPGGVAVNTQLASGRDRSPGLAADFIQACESAPSVLWVDKRTGKRVVQRDLSEARHLFLTDRAQLRRDMEQHAKEHGLLQGNRIARDTPTVKADITPALLDYLSLTMRETHRGRYVWWQFPYYELELGKGPGDTIQVARQRFLTEPTSVGDRTLTPGTRLSGDRQNLSITAKPIVLGERGLGKSGLVGAEPVAVPEFLSAYSLINLENAVLKVLGHDYEVFEDISIRSRAFATTRVVYNDRQNITTNPAAVSVNDDGTVTDNFANSLYAYASGLQIPALDDGFYIWVIHDIGLGQLKNSLSSKHQYLTKAQVEELTNLLLPATNREQGKVSGYAGSIDGFHIFSTNAHSMGAAGTEGVQTETLGTGSVLTRSSFVLGKAAIARAIGMEAEVRTDKNDDFQRLDSFTWLSHETTDSLDVDPAIHSEEQLRVIEVHTTDVQL